MYRLLFPKPIGEENIVNESRGSGEAKLQLQLLFVRRLCLTDQRFLLRVTITCRGMGSCLALTKGYSAVVAQSVVVVAVVVVADLRGM